MNIPPYITARLAAPPVMAAVSPLTAIQSTGIAIAARIDAMNAYDSGAAAQGQRVVAQVTWAKKPPATTMPARPARTSAIRSEAGGTVPVACAPSGCGDPRFTPDEGAGKLPRCRCARSWSQQVECAGCAARRCVGSVNVPRRVADRGRHSADNRAAGWRSRARRRRGRGMAVVRGARVHAHHQLTPSTAARDRCRAGPEWPSRWYVRVVSAEATPPAELEALAPARRRARRAVAPSRPRTRAGPPQRCRAPRGSA